MNPFYVTTSIAYVNGEPHVGFAMESVEADVLARWSRMQGRETFFCTGTDEHGEKIQKTADKLETTPQEICDKNAARFKALGQTLNISNDFFIRTSDKNVHWPSVQALWKKLEDNGDIEKRSYTANYCYGCEVFLTEKELNENGECPIHLRKPEVISEENYFFLLSKYSKKIAHLIETNELQIVPEFRKNEILNMAREGFHDVSFSRPSKKLPWGIPVPDDDSQNMYVWCDALTNYISALGYAESLDNPQESAHSPLPGEEKNLFQKFWNEGEVVHVIGKDILRFHAGIWIGMLLSAGEKLPDKIFVHGFLTSEGHKMSKSLGNVVDPFGEVEKYGADALRYFLLREVPVGQDADFSRKRFEEIYQAHLANGLGNLVSRVLNLSQKSSIAYPEGNSPSKIFPILETQTKKLEEKMENFSLHEAITEVFKVVDYCDKRINEEKPWELAKSDPEKNEIFLHEMLDCISWIGTHISPFLPETGEKIMSALPSPLAGGTEGGIPMLFPRLEKLSLPTETENTVSAEAPPMPTINFEITEKAKQAGIYAKYVFLENIAVKKTPKGLQKLCKKIATEWLDNGGKENPEWKRRITKQDEIKTRLGYSVEGNINASESLANLVIKNGKLPNFSNIVDLYNIISLKHGVSAGAHDCAFLSKNVRIDICTGNEAFEPMIGKEHMSLENHPIEKNEYAFFINEKEIGCRSDAGQCEKSKIIMGNKNILIYFQSPVGEEKWANDAMDEFIALLKEYKIL